MVDIAHIGPGLVVDAHRVQGHQDRMHETTQARNEYVHDEHCALRKQQKHAQDADDHVEFSHATGCQWLFKQQMVLVSSTNIRTRGSRSLAHVQAANSHSRRGWNWGRY